MYISISALKAPADMGVAAKVTISVPPAGILEIKGDRLNPLILFALVTWVRAVKKRVSKPVFLIVICSVMTLPGVPLNPVIDAPSIIGDPICSISISADADGLNAVPEIEIL